MIKKEVFLILLFLIGLASTCPDNCNDCDPSGNFCFACKQKYELSVMGKCVSNLVDKCIVYGPNQKCFVCQPSFELTGDGSRCIKQYTGCVNKNTNDGSCYECAFGKFLNNNICVGNINCAKPQFPCNTCAQGYQLANGQCIDKTVGCAQVRSNDGLCNKCKAGFKLMGYRCIDQKIYVPYCYVYYGSSSCERCKNGYSLFQNYCLLPIQIQAILEGSTTIQKTIASLLAQVGALTSISSTTSTNNTTTTTTTTTTIIINGGNTTTGGNLTTITTGGSTASNLIIANCNRYQGGQCIECTVGYLVASGLCKLMDVNCNSYELNTGKCVACISNYDLINQQCVKKQAVAVANCEVPNPANTATCLICTYGFYPSGNVCAKVSALCDGHNVQNGNCFNCLYGLTLKNGKCTDPNCLSLNGDACSSCASGYRVNANGVCQYNDVNCATFKGSACDTCKAGFYINIRGICVKLPQNCKFANIQVDGSCITCSDGFTITVNGGCVPTQAVNVTVTIVNCALVQNGICASCNSGYFVKNNACSKISVLCGAYNLTTGICLDCILGYTLINGACYDLNCLNQVQDKCSQCKANFKVIPPKTFCSYYDPNCASSTTTGCQSCKAGFNTGSSGLCEVVQTPVNNNSTITTPTVPTVPTGPSNGGVSDGDRDPNCKEYKNGKCSACSTGYYSGPDTKCVPVNPLCKQYNGIGACTSCYPGYALGNGICTAARDVDPYCKTKNAVGTCVECYPGFFVNGTKCTGLNPLCKASNVNNGQCTACYPGYVLNNGLCTVSFKDPNCQQYSKDNICIRCATRYFLNSLTVKCEQVNALCKDYNSVNGICTTCFDGYKISNGACVVGTNTNSDVYCKTVSVSGLCAECYSGFYIRIGKCEAISILCKTSNKQTGVCLSCYPGYLLSNGQCRVPGSGEQGDVNCRQFADSAKKICKTCYDGNYVKNGVCTGFNAYCKTSNINNGDCTSCYDGFSLYQGGCVVLQANVNLNNDPYCITPQGAACVKCAAGYYINQKGVCQQINPLCKTANSVTGDCVSCYEGYQIRDRTCSVAAIVSIPFCNIISASGSCVDCIDSYYARNGKCEPVSILCGGSYSKQTGQCTGCLGGYFLQGGQCIFPSFGLDPACEHYLNGFCDKCSRGFYLKSYVCTQINRFCTQFDYTKSTCTKCFNTTPQGAECV